MTGIAAGLSDVVTPEGSDGSPLFSVIVPSFNRVHFLEQALQSVFAQRFPSYELIVVNDGSTDTTATFLRSLGSRLTVLTQANGGPSAARNLGASQARGTYLAFLDSDDVWFPGTLELYARVLRESANPAFVAGCPRLFRDDAAPDIVESKNAKWLQFADYLISGDRWRWYGVSSFVVARRSFLDAGGFRPEFRVGEDADLTMRLGVAPGFVQITAPATFGYREHENNMSRGSRPLLEAATKLVDAELAGLYPGGKERRLERWRILARQVRPAAVASLKDGRVAAGLTLYGKTLVWQLAVGAWRFVFGFPLLFAFYVFARSRNSEA